MGRKHTQKSLNIKETRQKLEITALKMTKELKEEMNKDRKIMCDSTRISIKDRKY
jgi:hypothetical protein